MASDTLRTPFRPPAGSGQKTANGSAPPAPMTADVVTITPAMARDWLDHNTRNRKLRWPLIDAIARDMADGKWILNGETIKIAADGTIIDGQHRLSAVIKAGVTVQSFVIRGLPMEVQDTVDTGAVRKLADQLALRGEKDTNVLGSVTRWAFLWEQGQRSKTGGQFRCTHSEALAFFEAHPELRDAAIFATRARRQFSPIRASVYGTAWWLFTTISKERAGEFLEQVTKGENIGAGHPAHTLRARFLSASRIDERLTEFEQLALLIIAWNASREARDIHRLQLPKGGLTPKNFPEPR